MVAGPRGALGRGAGFASRAAPCPAVTKSGAGCNSGPKSEPAGRALSRRSAGPSAAGETRRGISEVGARYPVLPPPRRSRGVGRRPVGPRSAPGPGRSLLRGALALRPLRSNPLVAQPPAPDVGGPRSATPSATCRCSRSAASAPAARVLNPDGRRVTASGVASDGRWAAASGAASSGRRTTASGTGSDGRWPAASGESNARRSVASAGAPGGRTASTSGAASDGRRATASSSPSEPTCATAADPADAPG